MSTTPAPLPEIKLPLFSLSETPPPIKSILSHISSRTDEHCRMAWDMIDTHTSGDFTSQITLLAQRGIAAPRLYRGVMACWKAEAPDHFKELMAMGVEHAVRQSNLR